MLLSSRIFCRLRHTSAGPLAEHTEDAYCACVMLDSGILFRSETGLRSLENAEGYYSLTVAYPCPGRGLKKLRTEMGRMCPPPPLAVSALISL